jgi:hypothetical protein
MSLMLCFSKDKNFLALLIIIIFNHIFPNIIYHIETLHTNPISKTFIYVLSSYIFFRYRYDKLATFSNALTFCMIVAELYWWLTGYSKVPLIAYSISLVATSIITRHLILQRVLLFSFWPRIKKTPIDWNLYNLIGLAVPITALFVIEYFFRHILNIQSIVIYEAYPLLIYSTNAAVLWVLLNYALQKIGLFQA